MGDISLTIPTGEIIGLISPNGVGKATTIRMIMGIFNPGEGEILINRKNIAKEPLEARREFGIVPNNADIFLRLKGLEYPDFTGDIYGVDSRQRKQRITSLAETFEMKGALSDRIFSHSHGIRQKIVTIGALFSNPNIWILDGSMTGLDPQSSYSPRGMMKEHARKGNTVSFSTHVLEVTERLCDKVAIIDRGYIVLLGTLEELKQLHL